MSFGDIFMGNGFASYSPYDTRFRDYFINDLGWNANDLSSLGFYDTNSNGQGFGFLGLAPNNGSNWLKGINTGLNAISTLGSLGLGVANMFNANRALDMAKKSLQYQIAAGNRNIYNQAQIANNAYDQAGTVTAGLVGYKNKDGIYGGVDPEVQKAQEEQAKKNHLDGSPIYV